MPVEPNAKLSIKQLADRRIWKNFKRVIQEGDVITEHSPAETLHDLRKSCKKLRYLMEFFQNLYPEQQIKVFIKNLKGLQEVLGDFQDYAIQESTLKQFSEEMLANQVPANTLLAMGVLIQNLDTLRTQARDDFSAKFSHFKHHTSGALNGVTVEGHVTEIPVTRIRARKGIGILLESYRKISHGHVTPRSNSELPWCT